MTEKTIDNLLKVVELGIFAGFAYGIYNVFVSLL